MPCLCESTEMDGEAMTKLKSLKGRCSSFTYSIVDNYSW